MSKSPVGVPTTPATAVAASIVVSAWMARGAASEQQRRLFYLSIVTCAVAVGASVYNSYRVVLSGINYAPIYAAAEELEQLLLWSAAVLTIVSAVMTLSEATATVHLYLWRDYLNGHAPWILQRPVDEIMIDITILLADVIAWRIPSRHSM